MPATPAAAFRQAIDMASPVFLFYTNVSALANLFCTLKVSALVCVYVCECVCVCVCVCVFVCLHL